jgi:hypothetical protein
MILFIKSLLCETQFINILDFRLKINILIINILGIVILKFLEIFINKFIYILMDNLLKKKKHQTLAGRPTRPSRAPPFSPSSIYDTRGPPHGSFPPSLPGRPARPPVFLVSRGRVRRRRPEAGRTPVPLPLLGRSPPQNG